MHTIMKIIKSLEHVTSTCISRACVAQLFYIISTFIFDMAELVFDMAEHAICFFGIGLFFSPFAVNKRNEIYGGKSMKYPI